MTIASMWPLLVLGVAFTLFGGVLASLAMSQDRARRRPRPADRGIDDTE